MRRNLYLVAGFFAVGLGFAGIFLPVLPTTPFLLLALYCFARSSPKWEHWLLQNKLLGPYVQAYLSGRGMRMKQKVITIVMLWLTILISIVWVDKLWLRLLLLAVAIGVSIHLSLLKTDRS